MRVPNTYKIQTDIGVFQSIDGNLNNTLGCHKGVRALRGYFAPPPPYGVKKA